MARRLGSPLLPQKIRALIRVPSLEKTNRISRMKDSDLVQLARPAPRSHHYSDFFIPQQPRITELKLIRYITIICLVSYCGYLVMKSSLIYSCLSANDSYGGWIMVAMVMFAGSLVLLAIAVMMNKRVLYLLALPGSALEYAQIPMIHIAQ